ncbi:UreE family protein [Halococcoides cellulosivorans]|uniref:urease accessory protein UreE n=1 Tax=Halococcoides cellulosivorans TaxID=1679096 RepID=UPI00131F3617|nr:urease accessory protein UreE [Halococcoides cellulosivorans]
MSALECDPAVTVRLDADERRRSRVRTTTERGTEIGVIVGRRLRTGDVIASDDRRFVVEIEPVDALAIDLGDPDPLSTLELGHAIGNRHWEVAIEDGVAVVPVADSVERTRERIADALPTSATIEERDVSPAVFEDGPDHGHSHEPPRDGHTHDHGDDAHDHTRVDGRQAHQEDSS